MPANWKDLCRDVDVASTALADATKSVGKLLGKPPRNRNALGARPEYLRHRSKITSLSEPRHGDDETS